LIIGFFVKASKKLLTTEFHGVIKGAKTVFLRVNIVLHCG